MGAELQRAIATTAMSRLTDRQRRVLAVMGAEWMNSNQIATAANIRGYSPREIAARTANALAREYVLEKGGTRSAPLWRKTSSAAIDLSIL